MPERRGVFAASHDRRLTRRQFSAIVASGVGSVTLGPGCRFVREASAADRGVISARPKPGVTTSGEGTRALGLERSRDAILQLPASASRGPVPLIVLFHGAGGSGERLLRRFSDVAHAAGVAVLAPDSRGQTWDAIGGYFAADVMFVNRALERVFETTAVDPVRVAAAGFSDGATYALSLGLINGDLFSRILAYSPGFVVDGVVQGTPRVYVSHGTADGILPIDRCSRVIVPALRRRGYDVTFREFEGGHEVPVALAREGVEWVARNSP